MGHRSIHIRAIWRGEYLRVHPHCAEDVAAKNQRTEAGRAALLAASKARATTEVEVKALEWQESDTGEAVIAGDLYMIALDLDERGEAFALWRGKAIDPMGYYPTESEAKAAAQLDYATRIRSALVGGE